MTAREIQVSSYSMEKFKLGCCWYPVSATLEKLVTNGKFTSLLATPGHGIVFCDNGIVSIVYMSEAFDASKAGRRESRGFREPWPKP